MPTTNSFTFLGAGNGFNNCLEENSEITSANGITYKQLMDCFYNIGTINVFCQKAKTETGECESPAFSIGIDKLELDEPKDRVCETYTRFVKGPNYPAPPNYSFDHPLFLQVSPEVEGETSYFFEGTEDCGYIDFASADCGISVAFQPAIDDSGDGTDSNFNLSLIREDFSDFPSPPAILVYLYADTDLFLDFWEMWYYTFDATSLLNPNNDPYGWQIVTTVDFNGVTFYGHWQGFDPYDSNKHPHITSIEEYAYT
jgi:hypothetical protein